uniref:UDP-glucose:glycoprotein glucosyltransferase n=1 Tax=Tetradesmus obliquus TaxID=3088 RepID=A0A383VGR8_TETOB
MGRAAPVLLAAVGWLCLLLAVHASNQKGASISVRARWQGTPYLLEAAEFLADESQQLYWQFLDSLQLSDSSSGTECWHSIVDQASKLCYPQVAKILPVVLGVRQYSARLEMFRQLTKQLHPAAEEHCCFVDVHGSTVTEPAQLPAAIQQARAAAGNSSSSSAAGQLQEADHVYNPDQQDAPGAVAAVLHASPGTDCWAGLHAALKQAVKDAAADAPLVYAHRPLLPAACKAVHACASLGTEEQLVLPGYGVEAVLKNMEYSAMDEKSKADAAAAAAKKKLAGNADDALAGLDASQLGEVKGFKFDVLVKRKPQLVQELMTFRDVLMSSDEEESIKVWDVKDAGLQAASRVAAAADPLALLAEISQNFPAIVSSLTRQQVPDSLRSDTRYNQRYVNPGANFVILNGMLMDVKNFELYTFLDRLRIELRLQGQLQGLGLAPGTVQRLLETRLDHDPNGLADLRLDLSPMKHVLWLNNPARDKSHAHLSKHLQHLLNMYPGRLGPMAVNLMHIVSVGDPLSPECIALAGSLQRTAQRLQPIRAGMLPVVPEAVARAEARRANPGHTVDMPTWQTMSNSEKFTRAMLTIRSAFGTPAAWEFWAGMGREQMEKALASGDAKKVETTLQSMFVGQWSAAAGQARTNKAKVAAKKDSYKAWEELKSGSGYASEAGMQLADISGYLLSKGLAHLPKPSWWLNGMLAAIPEGGGAAVDQELSYAVMGEMQLLQEHIYFGRIDGEEPVIESVMELLVSVRHWNPRVLGMDDDGEAKKTVLSSALSHPGAKALTYLHPSKTAGRVKPVTHWVAVDLSQQRGRSLAAAAVGFLQDVEDDFEPAASRVALLLAPAKAATVLDVAVATALKAFAEDAKILSLLAQLLQQELGSKLAALPAAELASSPDWQQQLRAAAKEAGVAAADSWDCGEAAVKAALDSIAAMSDLVLTQLQLPLGSAAVVTNGRTVIDFNPAAGNATLAPALQPEDFALLQLYGASFSMGDALAKAVRAARAKKGADPVLADAAAASDVVMVAASALSAQVYPDSRFGSLAAKQISEVLGSLRGRGLSSGPPKESSELHLTAIINPLTREAQRLSQVLVLLADVLSPSVQIQLNPQMDLSELPLKSFYRYALPDFSRDESGRIAMPGAPSAYFNRLPQRRVLTLNLELPESWLVEPVMALHDFDNLRLADVHEQVAYAEYELEAIMLSGSCSEVGSDASRKARLPPPRGLQLHLGTSAQPHQVDTLVMQNLGFQQSHDKVDTLVMQNLGYFQLKASPGLWTLSIAPGRSQELYQLLSSTGGSSTHATLWGGSRSSDSSSSSSPAAASESNATTDVSTQVLLHSFTGKYLLLKVQKRPGKESEPLLPAADDMNAVAASAAAAKASNVINVFTVASGHMYERLQKIMILSVIKNTKSRVKFWIIKNYMSPHHRRIIPAMAQQVSLSNERG